MTAARQARVATAVAGAVLLGGCAREPVAPPHAPVYVYLIDALRRDHLHTYGYARATSPQLDALAADGVVFTQVTSTSPWTRPSVASLFTGLPALFHGVEGRGGVLPDTVRTWAEAMGQLGYATAGLVTNPNVDAVWGFAQGFDHYQLLANPGGGPVRSDVLHREWTKLATPTSRPMFTYLHALDPHAPYRPTRKYRMAFVGRRVLPGIDGARMPEHPTAEQVAAVVDLYDGEVLQNDAALGDLVAALKERGEYDRAWIVVTSDHGEEFWEHGLQGHGFGVWENLLRVPLVIKPPGGRAGAAGRALRALADRPMPLHALPDLLGPLLDAHWKPMTADNAVRLAVEPEVIARWLAPVPDAVPRGARAAGPVPAVRIASSQLDQRSELMVERGGVKLVWRDQSREFAAMRYLCFDLDRDPGETDDLWPERAPEAARALEPDLRQLAEDAAWGIELRYNGSEPAPALVFRGTQPMRQGWVPPGGHPHAFEFLYLRNELHWTPAPGERIFVRLEPGSALSLGSAQGAEAPPLVVWPAAAGGQPPSLPLAVRAVGPARFEHGDGQLAPQPSAEVLQALRALGYVQ